MGWMRRGDGVKMRGVWGEVVGGRVKGLMMWSGWEDSGEGCEFKRRG